MEKIYIYSSTNYNVDAKTFNTIRDVTKFKQAYLPGIFAIANKKEFNALYKTAKQANIQKPKEWAFNRLNMDGKILGIL